MISNYQLLKHKIVNNSFQALIHKQFFPDFEFTAMKEYNISLPDTTQLVKQIIDNCYYYTINQEYCYDFIAKYSIEQLNEFIDNQHRDMDKYLETLLKYNHIGKKEYQTTKNQYDKLVFIEGIAFKKDYILSIINKEKYEELMDSHRQEILPQLNNYSKERKSIGISREKIREITQYTYNPTLEDGRSVLINWQKDLLNDQNRYIFVVGSRQIGKSYTLGQLAIENSFLPNQRILVCSFTNENTTIIRDYILDFIENFNDGDFEWNKREAYIENKFSKTRIYFRSLSEDAKRIRGKKFHLIIIDEAAFVSNAIYEKVLKPTTTTTHGRIISISTPDKRNWFYDEVLEVKRGKKNSSVYTITIEDNPFVDDELREEIMMKKNNPIIRNERFGEFVGSGNTLFEPFLLDFYPKTRRSDNYVLVYDPARKNDRAGYDLIHVRNGEATSILSGFIPDGIDPVTKVYNEKLDLKKDWDKQAEFLKKIWLQNPNTIFGMDVTGVGDGVISIFKSHGLKVDYAVQYTSGTGETEDDRRHYGTTKHMRVGKSVLINNLLDYVDNEIIKFYEYTNKDLIEEVSYAEYTTGKFGQPAFTSSFYDDILNACMIGCYIINKEQLLSKFDPLERFNNGYDEFSPNAHGFETFEEYKMSMKKGDCW